MKLCWFACLMIAIFAGVPFAAPGQAPAAGKQVLHRCDNPPCCNPAHLFIGTPASNAADRSAKGRSGRGERAGTAKMTAAQVRAIRALANSGVSYRKIAERFGIGSSNVGLIVTRTTWRHLG